jgi:hypothetical protein
MMSGRSEVDRGNAASGAALRGIDWRDVPIRSDGGVMDTMSITGVEVELTDHDGNAFAILGRTQAAMRDADVAQEVVARYLSEATAGDYDHLLQVTMRYVEVL